MAMTRLSFCHRFTLIQRNHAPFQVRNFPKLVSQVRHSKMSRNCRQSQASLTKRRRKGQSHKNFLSNRGCRTRNGKKRMSRHTPDASRRCHPLQEATKVPRAKRRMKSCANELTAENERGFSPPESTIVGTERAEAAKEPHVE